MTTHNSKTISKINRETKEGKILWKVSNNYPPSLSGTEVLIGPVYSCNVLNKTIQLYKFQTKHYYDEDAYHWLVGYRLEFINSQGNSEWEFPEDIAISNLYETVRYQTSNVDDFISKYLSEDEKNNEDEERLKV